ncbi:MAG: DUF427 domain-containing protein [Nitriliruptorales bacterium]
MALTLGTGPFASPPGGEFNFTRPRDHVLYLEGSPRRVRIEFNGGIVADSTQVKLLHETGLLPVYYFPQQDVRMDLLAPTEKHTTCPVKGEASYFTLTVGDRSAADAIWTYPEPLDDAPKELAGLVAFYWNKMDAWYEEDEQVGVHPRDPYHRVDALRSARRVKVVIDGQVVAESERPVMLFETGLPPRFYLPPEDVRADVLEDSDHHTGCPYKGTASYKSVAVNGTTHENLVWYYPEPDEGISVITGRYAFYNEKVDLEIDGEPLDRPVTPFS